MYTSINSIFEINLLSTDRRLIYKHDKMYLLYLLFNKFKINKTMGWYNYCFVGNIWCDSR